MKRLFSFFLALVMFAALIPVTVRAEELPQLDAPTNLEWHYTESGKYRPGIIRFNTGKLHQREFHIEVWRVGDWTYRYAMSTYDYDDNGVIAYDFLMSGDLEDGEYYFKVNARGDGVNYRDSETVTSEVWTYKAPELRLEKADNLTWDWPRLSFTLPEDDTYIGGYYISFYFSESQNEEPDFKRGVLLYDTYEEALEIFNTFYDRMTQECGVGYYYYQVDLVSSDITKCKSSHSEMSTGYFLDEVVMSVPYKLDEMANNAENLSPEEIRNTVQSMDNSVLLGAMQADYSETGVIADLATLEAAVGGAADVIVANSDIPFAADKVSIIGANLNTASSDGEISLVVDKPHQDHVLDTMYNNSVAVKFSMDLNNVQNPQNLEVPVRISLPVPENINPDFLLVLHYNADGTIEEIFPRTYTEDGITYASFILTSFSDFVLTEFVLEEPEPTEPPATEPPETEPPATEPPETEPPATEPPETEPPATEPPATEPPVTEPLVTEPPVTEPPATEPPDTEPALPAVTGTYTTDLVMPAADLGVSAPDAVLRATLTFTEDGKASAEWEAVDLTAFKVFFHDMFVNSYYAMAYGAGITDINEIEAFCMESTGMSVSAYMDTIVTDEAMKAAFTPASTAGKYTCAQEQSVIYTDLPIMDVPSDPTVPNSFSVENGTLYLNAASYGKADYTFVCTKK